MADSIPTYITFGPLPDAVAAEVELVTKTRQESTPPITDPIAKAVGHIRPVDVALNRDGYVWLELSAYGGLDGIEDLLTALVAADLGYDARQSAIYEFDGRLIRRRTGWATPHEVSLNRSGEPFITETEVCEILDNPDIDTADALRAHFGWEVPDLIPTDVARLEGGEA